MQSAEQNIAGLNLNDATLGESGEPGQYLTFTLGGEDYAIDILRVMEIKGWGLVRPLPNTPEYVKGVMDLRGQIVAVVDLRARFFMERIDYTPTTVTVILSVESQGRSSVIGVVVDSVSDVLEVAQKKIQSAPNLGLHINVCYMSGMVIHNGKMIVLLDIDKFLNPEEMGLGVNMQGDTV
ncbi:MAG: chemotaxis protein CheW [Gammaproteobacteria bacterium]|nr:chemotaxis protein CheW [Gammaproteobacteria bacterium]